MRTQVAQQRYAIIDARPQTTDDNPSSVVNRPWSDMIIPLAVLLTAFALRAAPLLQNRFHPDEALYATFGRLIASGRDPMLSTTVVDKPPLPFYLMAASMTLFGQTEFAARLPTLFASAISSALIYQLGCRLYNRRAAALAAVVLALSPLAILFAITLFTDTLLVAFLLWALLMATRQKWSWAGFAFGLAFACKQTAIFFLPLVFVVGIIQFFYRTPAPALTRSGGAGGERGERREKNIKDSANSALSAVKEFLFPALFCAAVIFIWDFARHAPISFWAQGYSDNNPGRLVRSTEIWPRLTAWIDLLHYLTGSRIAELVFLVGLPLLLLFHRRRTLAAVYDFALTGFALAFAAVYWLFAFNVWDRYLLALTPIVALLLGRIIDCSLPRLQTAPTFPIRNSQFSIRHSPFIIRHSSLFIVSLFIVSLFIPSLAASRSGFPVGGDHGAYDGIDQIAETLHTVPDGSVLYDHWLSWEWGFYLFDGPVYVSWFPGPDSLAADLKSFGRTSPRYIVAPSWESFTEVQSAIEAAGFKLEVVQTANRRDGTLSFTLYRIWPK